MNRIARTPRPSRALVIAAVAACTFAAAILGAATLGGQPAAARAGVAGNPDVARWCVSWKRTGRPTRMYIGDGWIDRVPEP
jgi:hypothetical protein